MEWSFFVKAWVPFIRGCFLLVLFQINPLILKKRFFFEKSIRFLQFSRMTLLLKKFELVIHWFYLKRGQCIFTLSLLFPLREKMQFKTLCLNKCEFPHPRIRWLTFSQRFWRKCWSTCIYHLPCEKRMATLYCIPFISPGPKDALRHVCLKLTRRFLRWRILNVVIVFSLLCHGLVPLGKRYDISFEPPGHQNALCWVWLKLPL